MQGQSDGINSGAIRSDLTTMNVSASRWCKIFGHKIRNYADGKFCRECWKSESEITKEKEDGKETTE